jgi:hypothetical protein
MVESVAVLSDIHGVLPVLDAVLAEPDVQGAGRIVLTGYGIADWADYLLHARASGGDALSVMAPRDGRTGE